MRCAAAAMIALLTSAWPVAAQDSHLLVIVGLSGSPENGDLFHRWALGLVEAAEGRYGLQKENVVYLSEDPARDPARIDGRATREGIRGAVERLATRARPGDRVFVVLIGHGASAQGEARFNLPGLDLSAREYAGLLDRLGAQTVVFANTASASGGFVAALAGRDRVVIAATRNEGERNQTRFGEFFVEAITGSDGDIDKDGRVSMAEAFTWAQRRVAESYKRDGQLQTEHALLDDNGDGAGTDATGQPGGDGALARTLYLSASVDGRPGPNAAVDPALRALYDEQRALEQRVAALKSSRAKMDAAEYERELEQLLIALARKSREIREKEKR